MDYGGFRHGSKLFETSLMAIQVYNCAPWIQGGENASLTVVQMEYNTVINKQ